MNTAIIFIWRLEFHRSSTDSRLSLTTLSSYTRDLHVHVYSSTATYELLSECSSKAPLLTLTLVSHIMILFLSPPEINKFPCKYRHRTIPIWPSNTWRQKPKQVEDLLIDYQYHIKNKFNLGIWIERLYMWHACIVPQSYSTVSWSWC